MPPGWGAYPPPAPQPGVIPLRPLSVSDILQGAISTMRKHWRVVLGVSFLVSLIIEIVSTLVTSSTVNDAAWQRLQSQQTPTSQDVLNGLGSAAGSAGVTGLVGLLGQIFATAILTIVVSRAVLGRHVTAAESWRDARPRLPRLLGLTLLLPLIATVLFSVGVAPGLLVAAFGTDNADNAGNTGLGLAVLGFLAVLPVVLWLMVSLSLAAPALMLEKQGVFASLSRSMRLVRGSWWRVLGVELLGAMLVLLISAIIAMPFSILGMIVAGQGPSVAVSSTLPTSWPYLILVGIGSVLGSTLTLPLSAGITALLYVDQRIRREGLDLELARAAAS